jgi:hypothetical protein
LLRIITAHPLDQQEVFGRLLLEMADKDHDLPEYDSGLKGPGPFFMPGILKLECLYVEPGQITVEGKSEEGKQLRLGMSGHAAESLLRKQHEGHPKFSEPIDVTTVEIPEGVESVELGFASDFIRFQQVESDAFRALEFVNPKGQRVIVPMSWDAYRQLLRTLEDSVSPSPKIH